MCIKLVLFLVKCFKIIYCKHLLSSHYSKFWPWPGREGNIPYTASEPHFTYLRQCTSPEGFWTSPKQSSGNDFPFIIDNFYLNREALWGCALPQLGKMRFGSCGGGGCRPSLPWQNQKQCKNKSVLTQLPFLEIKANFNRLQNTVLKSWNFYSYFFKANQNDFQHFLVIQLRLDIWVITEKLWNRKTT